MLKERLAGPIAVIDELCERPAGFNAAGSAGMRLLARFFSPNHPRMAPPDLFKPLVEKTAENFEILSVPADKAYLSYENLEQIHNLGGTAWVPFKSTSTQGEAGSVWEKMFPVLQSAPRGFP